MAKDNGNAAMLAELPSRPRGIRQRDHVPASHSKEWNEFYWYVSIRYNVTG